MNELYQDSLSITIHIISYQVQRQVRWRQMNHIRLSPNTYKINNHYNNYSKRQIKVMVKVIYDVMRYRFTFCRRSFLFKLSRSILSVKSKTFEQSFSKTLKLSWIFCLTTYQINWFIHDIPTQSYHMASKSYSYV